MNQRKPRFSVKGVSFDDNDADLCVAENDCSENILRLGCHILPLPTTSFLEADKLPQKTSEEKHLAGVVAVLAPLIL